MEDLADMGALRYYRRFYETAALGIGGKAMFSVCLITVWRSDCYHSLDQSLQTSLSSHIASLWYRRRNPEFALSHH